MADTIPTVLTTKCFYTRLGVARHASEDEIRTAYKKMAIKLHPDKCKHPRAEEAFKKIGEAHGTLTDPEKRRIYDQLGEEGLSGGGAPGMRRGHVHADDLFDIFDILRGQHTGHGQQQRRQHQHREQRVNPTVIQMLNTLPIIILVLVYLISGIGLNVQESQPYSLNYDFERGFTSRRETQDRRQIPYYVKRNFDTQFGRSAPMLREVDRSVTVSYREYLDAKCSNEKSQRERRRRDARVRYSNSAEIERQISQMPTPSCQEYKKLFGRKR